MPVNERLNYRAKNIYDSRCKSEDNEGEYEKPGSLFEGFPTEADK